MYQYDSIDKQLLSERVAQFRDQTKRYLAGELSDSEFLPLRLQNGLYIQRLAPMLRVAVPATMIKAIRMYPLDKTSNSIGHVLKMCPTFLPI